MLMMMMTMMVIALQIEHKIMIIYEDDTLFETSLKTELMRDELDIAS